MDTVYPFTHVAHSRGVVRCWSCSLEALFLDTVPILMKNIYFHGHFHSENNTEHNFYGQLFHVDIGNHICECQQYRSKTRNQLSSIRLLSTLNLCWVARGWSLSQLSLGERQGNPGKVACNEPATNLQYKEKTTAHTQHSHLRAT